MAPRQNPTLTALDAESITRLIAQRDAAWHVLIQTQRQLNAATAVTCRAHGVTATGQSGPARVEYTLRGPAPLGTETVHFVLPGRAGMEAN